MHAGPTDTDNDVVIARGKGPRRLGGGGKGGEKGGVCNSVNNQNKVKN